MNPKTICLAALTITLTLFTPGCAVLQGGPETEGDIALLAQDLQDLAAAGTTYALAENPNHRADIIRVRDEIAALAPTFDGGPITFDQLLSRLQTLPINELRSKEAILAITAAKITLRRAGRNVELGNIPNIKPLADGLVLGMTEGLNTVPEL